MSDSLDERTLASLSDILASLVSDSTARHPGKGFIADDTAVLAQEMRSTLVRANWPDDSAKDAVARILALTRSLLRAPLPGRTIRSGLVREIVLVATVQPGGDERWVASRRVFELRDRMVALYARAAGVRLVVPWLRRRAERRIEKQAVMVRRELAEAEESLRDVWRPYG